MWMLMEGILQYLLFVKVMNTYFTNYIIKTAIPAWGIPILPVVLILAIDTELYKGGDNYCWMSLDAFYYGFALPVDLIILTNLAIFVLVVVSLCRRKDMSKHSTQSRNQTMVNIRASFICFFVLDDARIVFQYIFCILTSLQGFIIFVMMTARDKKVHQYWLSVCCCRRQAETSSKSGNGSNSQTPMHIPRVHGDRSNQGRSPKNSTSFASLGQSRDGGVMGPAHGDIPRSRKSYGEREQVLF